MNRTERVVRAKIYDLFRSGERRIDSEILALELALSSADVTRALAQLESEHRLALAVDGSVLMAHPFSGVDTGHTATVDGKTWWSNCAWDALAILALLGDGVATCPEGPKWTVTDGEVSPEGFVHLLVPAKHFWDDVVFT